MPILSRRSWTRTNKNTLHCSKRYEVDMRESHAAKGMDRAEHLACGVCREGGTDSRSKLLHQPQALPHQHAVLRGI